MAVRLNPYITFDGNTREAMNRYREVLGGELDVTTFGEGGVPAELGPPEQVMHAVLETPHGFTLMAADKPTVMDVTAGDNVAVSISGDDETLMRGWWDGLSEGGTVAMPLEKASWGDTFGQCTDRFGITWLMNIAGTPA